MATYSNILDELRQLYAATPDAKKASYKASDFSYNTGSLRCPTCDGTGQISLDMQFLPDVDIICPDCGGSRYGHAAEKIIYRDKHASAEESGISLPQAMALTVDEALERFSSVKKVCERLQMLHALGLGYLTLGQPSPTLSGGEAQRIKLVSELTKVKDSVSTRGRKSPHTLYVLDEPTVGLHMADVDKLIGVLKRLVDAGNTVIVVEHNLDLMAQADWIVDMGPEGGANGGRVVAAGTPETLTSTNTHTGRALKAHMDAH